MGFTFLKKSWLPNLKRRAGHWRLTEGTGNAVNITSHDGLWRPLLVRAYDAGNVAGTGRFTRTAYDADGRVSFQSYPSVQQQPDHGRMDELRRAGPGDVDPAKVTANRGC